MLGLTRRTVRSGAAAVAAALLLGGCAPRTDPSVLATVDGAEITAGAVASRMDSTVEEYIWTGDAAPGERARRALDVAVRDAALAAAARDDGATGSSQSELLSGLLVAERAAHPELDAASVSDDEAREWFESNGDDFAQVHHAEVTWVAVDDPDTARAAHAAWTADPRLGPADLALGDEDTWGDAAVGHDSEIHVMVERLVNAVRTEGEIGLDLDADTGLWWLVRVDSAALAEPEWDEVLAGRVRTAMAHERETAHLAGLAQEACGGPCGELHEENVDAFVAQRERDYFARDARTAGSEA
ncbi:hypothetical protein [Myceligenerans crystallogenes]|uniref:SurA N-terminal domain-containing protein n=1 Tax=Myceligenerans crystallogenes TaxID=316335 RepID=A0ABN2N3X0_9MICO